MRILLSICGFAWPRLSFMARPTKAPIAFSLPPLMSATISEFASMTFLAKASISLGSDF